MNVFTSGHRNQPWVWQVTGLCFILGFLLAGSVQTVTTIRRDGSSPPRVGQPPGGVSASLAAKVRDMEKEIASLRDQKTKLESTLAQGTGEAKALNDELQKTKLLAGLTPVRGVGIVLTLQDSKKRPPSDRIAERDKYTIHDLDLQQAVNELGASGAEAIAINGQRVIGRTAIRCVGPTIQVNGVPLSNPFEVSAIGDPDTLASALNLPWGLLDEMRRYDPAMCRITKRGKGHELELPAYTGNTDVRYAKPAGTSGHDRSGT
jgi:uncharacterized protein YlxW (UPF0749 family)